MNLLYANDEKGAYPASWYAATCEFLAPCPAVEGEKTADVCVIGAGFTGLSAALHLAKTGLSVIVLDAQRIGFGASGRNGGQLGSGQRIDQRDLLQMFGEDSARRLWELGEESKATVVSLIR
ncbi:MAG: NAD(P)/FAD-dependent oxidoreductase, partial [Paracoccaceae bacterium]